MTSDQSKIIAQNSISLVGQFFNNLPENDKKLLPIILNNHVIWFGNYDDYSIGIFCVTDEGIKKVRKFEKEGLPPFPGLFISEHSNTSHLPVAIKAEGSCNYFESNKSTNLISFEISSKASFSVLDHIQEIKDPSGKEIKYQVDLAFFLGKTPKEQWSKFKPRLMDLLQFTLNIWKNMP